MITTSLSRRHRRAFSLVELLAVMGIIIALGGLSMSAMSSLKRSSSVQRAGLLVMGHLEQTRLTAAARNRPAEFRLYRRSPTENFTAVQVLVLEGDDMSPVTPIVPLPDGTAVASDSRSSLISSASSGSTSENGGWEYRAFEVYANGETSLPQGGSRPYLALGQQTDLDQTDQGHRLQAVVIDPVTSRVKIISR